MYDTVVVLVIGGGLVVGTRSYTAAPLRSARRPAQKASAGPAPLRAQARPRVRGHRRQQFGQLDAKRALHLLDPLHSGRGLRDI